TFSAFQVPPPPPPRIGSLEYDLNSPEYNFRWDSFADFELWRKEEERTKGIELRRVKTYAGPASQVYDNRYRFVCSRKGTGGVKAYTKLRPDWTRKRESKRTDCECVLIIKKYPGTSVILGNYTNEHNHSLGNENLRFT
ncbi:hypothetical protein R3P38DRAFT_2430387, partial [Favolaschia claudopus]